MNDLEQSLNKDKWIISSEEMNFIKNKDVNNQLIVAIKLKFFEQYGYKLVDIASINAEIINYIADLLKVESNSVAFYNWNSRTSRSHDDAIRVYLGFRTIDKKDLEVLRIWLFEQHMPFGVSYEVIKERAYIHLFNLKIEPLVMARMERLLKSWIYQFEEEFFIHWSNVLTQDDKNSLDRLIQKSYDNILFKILETLPLPLQSSTSKKPSEKPTNNIEVIQSELTLNDLKYNYGKASLETITACAKKLAQIKQINLLSLPDIEKMPINLAKKYHLQVMNSFSSELSQIVDNKRHVKLLCFCYYQSIYLTDNLIDILIQLVHRIDIRAKKKVMKEFWENRKETYNKDRILVNIAEISINNPKGIIEEKIYPKVSKEVLENILKKSRGEAYYKERKYSHMHSSYAKHYRRMISVIFDNIEFGTNNEYEPILAAIELIKKYRDSSQVFYPSISSNDNVVLDKVIPKMYLDLVTEDVAGGYVLQLCKREPSDDQIKKNVIYLYLKEQFAGQKLEQKIERSTGQLLELGQTSNQSISKSCSKSTSHPLSPTQSKSISLYYTAIGIKKLIRAEIPSDKIASFISIKNKLEKLGKLTEPEELKDLEELDLKNDQLQLSSPLQLSSSEKKELLEFILKQGLIASVKKVNRIGYEMGTLLSLQSKLRCKEIWVKSAAKYCNPDKDLPQDFDKNRNNYYNELNQPEKAEEFIDKLQTELDKALTILNKNILKNKKVSITKRRGKPWIKVSPLKPQDEPANIEKLKQEIADIWPHVNLLDILKEVELRVDLSSSFQSTASKELISAQDLQFKLLLTIFALATNTGLKRIGTSASNANYDDLKYVLRRYITKDNLRSAIIRIVNDSLRIRDNELFGNLNISCACDSTKFNAWDQNMMSEWHVRYGGRGIMIYWHVDKKALCVYSQLKTCSSSEVIAMIEGIILHSTNAEIEKSYVDSHGQSLVAFAFSHLLNFELLPRLKLIGPEKLYVGASSSNINNNNNNYCNIRSILTRAIDWNMIAKYYDQLIKYTTALRLKTAEPEALLKRFTSNTVKHPIYLALQELGRVIKTIFLCRYLSSEELRQEIHEGLNVIERWNSVNDFIYYGRKSTISTNDPSMKEIIVLSLHLLQASLVYMNTLMIQHVLKLPHWQNRLTIEDKRAISPLIYAHVNPYGIFKLDMNKRMVI